MAIPIELRSDALAQITDNQLREPMNEHDFAREMRRYRRERANRRNPANERRIALIRKMEVQDGHLDDEDMRELADLQRQFGLPYDP